MAIRFAQRLAFAISGFADSLSFGQVVRFNDSDDVDKYLDLTESQKQRVIPSESDERERDMLFAKIIRDIRKRHIKLSFKPETVTIVTIPPEDDPMHLQALFFWCAYFDEEIPRILEAYTLLGPDADAEAMRRAIDKITFENSSHRTDAFMAVSQREGVDIRLD